MRIRIQIFAVLLTYSLALQIHALDNQDESNPNPFSQAKFIPDISVILDTTFVFRSLPNYHEYERPGFMYHHEDGGTQHHAHGMNADNGFNVNYVELVFSSQADPYFDLSAILHASTDGAEIEEAYFSTLQLPYGLKIKGGKFLSSIGRINGMHAHSWDFADIPLMYQAFFDVHLCEIGAQIHWLAPLPFYFLAGVEILQGANETSFGTEGFTAASREIDDARYPNLLASYIKSSLDFGRLTVLAGASGLYGKTRINHGIDAPQDADNYGFYGKTAIAGTDLTIRYDVSSYQYIALQSEYFYRYKTGDAFEYDAATDTTTRSDFTAKQSGLYAQLIIRTGKHTRAGLRYDLLAQNDISNADDIASNMPRYSAMIEYNPSEFSRLRLQYNNDHSLYTETGRNKVNHQIIVQCNLSIGAHGAHTF